MMKFFTAFVVTSAFLFGYIGLSAPAKVEIQPLVPSKIVNSKKINPIKVPNTTCIVSGMEVSHLTLEEYMALCLEQRNWLNIAIDYKGRNII